jgi:hypothetical protein
MLNVNIKNDRVCFLILFKTSEKKAKAKKQSSAQIG